MKKKFYLFFTRSAFLIVLMVFCHLCSDYVEPFSSEDVRLAYGAGIAFGGCLIFIAILIVDCVDSFFDWLRHRKDVEDKKS